MAQLVIYPDWPIRLLKYMQADFVDRSIEGKPMQHDFRELYMGLAKYAMERKLLSNIEEIPNFLLPDMSRPEF